VHYPFFVYFYILFFIYGDILKIQPKCAHCLLSRVHFEAELSTEDKDLQYKAVKAGLEVLGDKFHPEASATKVSTAIHRNAYEILNDKDPYLEKKRISNKIALDLLPIAKKLIKYNDPVESFRKAVIASIIGNSFDFGVLGFEIKEDFEKEFKELFKKGLDIDDTEKIIPLLPKVVYFADNCGEIVFDTLVFKAIKRFKGKITLVVRGAPILNDVTMETVEELNLNKEVDDVLTTSSNAIGVCLEEASKELLEAMENATLIISKGMANYESLSEYEIKKPIAYLLRAKCEPVANSIGAEVGMMVAKLIVA